MSKHPYYFICYASRPRNGCIELHNWASGIHPFEFLKQMRKTVPATVFTVVSWQPISEAEYIIYNEMSESQLTDYQKNR